MINGQLTSLAYAFRWHARRTNSETCYLAVSHHENYKRLPAFWSKTEELASTDNRSQNYEVLTLPGLLDRIEFLLDSAYFFICGEVYKQVIGLPMCFVPTGLMASMVCFTYEISYTARVLYRLLKEGGYARVRSRPRARLFRRSATTLH